MEKVVEVKVEHSPGRGHATLGIGDKSAFDACVRYRRPDGNGGLLAIETKYTDCFSRDRGTSADGRARDALVGTGTMTEAGWKTARAMRTEQLWRTHALAETLRCEGSCAQVSYIVLHAAGDRECAAVLPQYQECMSDLARQEQRFRSLTLEDCISAAREVLSGDGKVWVDQFHERYLDWTPVETLLGAA